MNYLKRKKEKFFILSNNVFDYELNKFLGMSDLIIYMYLSRCSNNNENAFPSYQKISSCCCCSRNTAISCIKRLIEIKLIMKEKRNNTSNIYTINDIEDVFILKNGIIELIDVQNKKPSETSLDDSLTLSHKKQNASKIDNVLTENMLSENEVKVNTDNKKCEEIFNFWNSKKIISHKSISEKLQKKLNEILKKYSLDDVKKAIKRYDEVLKDRSYFYNYKWSLEEFLSRKKGIVEFFDDGSKWKSYQNHLNNSGKAYFSEGGMEQYEDIFNMFDE